MADAVKLTELLHDQDILLNVQISSKSAVLALAAERLAQTTGLESAAILKALTDREKLGSTAISRGIAVPHAGVDSLAKSAAVFLRLARPIDFEAPDHDPVDLVFVTIWPSDMRNEMLATLGQLCRSLREPPLLQEFRTAADAAQTRSLLTAIDNQPSPTKEK
ncbi:MAG: PTS sugar transporter subunit IIA [Hyphomicrobiaceae bacterium]